jgi:hypothetical protein
MLPTRAGLLLRIYKIRKMELTRMHGIIRVASSSSGSLGLRDQSRCANRRKEQRRFYPQQTKAECLSGHFPFRT